MDTWVDVYHHFAIEDISDILWESLDEDAIFWNARNAIVASIANITITTISSTRVNPFLLIFIQDF